MTQSSKAHGQDTSSAPELFGLGYRAAYRAWFDSMREVLIAQLDEEIASKPNSRLDRSVERMREVIESDGVVRMYVTQMLKQSHGKTNSDVVVRDIPHLLALLNRIIRRTPKYDADPKHRGASAFPMSVLFTSMMATPAGEQVFRNAAFNATLTEVLQTWCAYLDTQESWDQKKEEGGWLSKSARAYLHMDEYVIPSAGFQSYNAFFHREIKKSVRPLIGPDDPTVIVSPNDGTVYQTVSNIQRSTDFWMKGQTYSLSNMLNGDRNRIESFLGGTVIQTFLSGADYHRFHAPVAGKVVGCEVVQGLTFSQRNAQLEPGAGTASLGYEASVNTRGIIYIESPHECIGTVCVMPIGITEISSVRFCQDIKVGSQVLKGQELGHFSYGGSTLCVVFQKGAVKHFVSQPASVASGSAQASARLQVNGMMAKAKELEVH